MRIRYRIRCAFGKWVNTPFGFMPKKSYDFECGAPIPRLLSLVMEGSDGDIALIRLNKQKAINELITDDDDEVVKVINSLTATFAPYSVISDYSHELAGIPVADPLVFPLVQWAIQLYGERVVLAPSEDVIFVIRRAV